MATRVWTRLLAVLFVGACLGAALAAAGAFDAWQGQTAF